MPTPGLDNKTQKWKRENEFDAPGSDALCASTDFMTLEIIDWLNRQAPSERHQPECVTFAKVWDHRLSEELSMLSQAHTPRGGATRWPLVAGFQLTN